MQGATSGSGGDGVSRARKERTEVFLFQLVAKHEAVAVFEKDGREGLGGEREEEAEHLERISPSSVRTRECN